MGLPNRLEVLIARYYYEAGNRKEDIMKLFKIRPETLEDILVRHKKEFVKGA